MSTAHRCTYVHVATEDTITQCGHFVEMDGPGVPVCHEHRYATRNPPARSVVYFITWGAYVKIGITTIGPEARMKQIMSGGTIIPPDVTGKPMVAATINGGADAEAMLHELFGAWRVAGEWFRREGDVSRVMDWFAAKATADILLAEQDAVPERVTPQAENRYVDVVF